MPTIYTAIFGPYDTLKDPLVITPGWNYVCYTDQDFKSDVWQIKKTPKLLDDPRMLARWFKIRFNLFIRDEESIWIDGSFIINCDLNKWWKDNFNGIMTCIKHPIRNCIYDEANACIKFGRGNNVDIVNQVAAYAPLVPKNNGVIQSGILMRKKTPLTSLICRGWWDQIEKYSDRDQISFGKIAALYPGAINYISWDYRTGKEFIFKPHNKKI